MKPSRSSRSIHDVRQEEELWPVKQEQYNNSFDSVNIKYLMFDNMKSVIFTESTTSQKRASIIYKIDSRSDGNRMQFIFFRTLFPKSAIEAFHATKYSVILKANSQSSIEQLGMCAIRLRHKDKTVRCRFFALPGNSPVMIDMPGIGLLGILKKTCYVVGDQQSERRFNSHTVQPSNSSGCKANTGQWIKTNNVDVVDARGH